MMTTRKQFVDRLLADRTIADRVMELRMEFETLVRAAFSEDDPGGFAPDQKAAAFRPSPHLEVAAVQGRLKRLFFGAAEQGDVITVLAFLQAGCPVNFQDTKTGETILHVAAAVNAVDVVRALVAQEECDYLMRDKQGRLAAELAFTEADNIAVGRLLGRKASEQAMKQGARLSRR